MDAESKIAKQASLHREERRVLVGITGASGSIYAERLIEVLNDSVDSVDRVYLVMTDSGEKVAQYELRKKEIGFSLIDYLKEPAKYPRIRRFAQDDLFAPVASGTAAPTHMVVLPCSMGSLARMAQGFSGNLLERAADVMIKQRRPLVVVPRETPLSSIHLRNMLTLSELGVFVVPAMPGFYLHPKSVPELVDFMVGRILECLGMHHQLYRPWNRRMI